MGFFDRFKSKPAPTADPRLAEIAQAYGLAWKKMDLPWLGGSWWDGLFSSQRLAVYEQGPHWRVTVGKPEEVTEFYLGAVDRAGAVLAGRVTLEKLLAPEDREVGKCYVLNAIPEGEFDWPQLRQPELVKALRELAALDELCIFESMQGVEMILHGNQMDRAKFDANVGLALGMLQGLERWRNQQR